MKLNKRSLIAGTTFLVVGLSGPSSAQDTWQGYYGGLSGGVGSFNGRAMDWGDAALGGPDGDIDLRGFGGMFGAQAGYNYQLGGLVIGLEGDISWTGYGEDKLFDVFTVSGAEYVKANMDWLATVRGRLGLANDRAMAYVTGGLALAGVEHCANDDSVNPCSVDNDDDIAWSGTRPGLVAGAGVEARLTDRWSFKSEYLYLATADKYLIYDTSRGQDIDFGFDAHLFRIGLNYHLNGLPAGTGSAMESGGTWQGFYAGLNGGIGSFNGRAMDWGDDVFDGPDGDIDLRGFAGIFGAQAGYNYQFDGFVLGIEGDISWTGFSEENTFENDAFVKANMDWLATVRGRMGVANDRAMAYVTGGLALAGVEHCGNDNHTSPCSIDGGDDIAWSGTRPGLVAGAGVEARLADNWSFKSEYLYVVTADKTLDYETTFLQEIDFGFDAHLFRVGLNYHLGGLPLTGGSDVPSGGPWQGLYAGASGGLGFFSGRARDWDDVIFDGPDGDYDVRGFAGMAGAQAGYNHQVDGVVFGLEADASWTGFNAAKTFDPSPIVGDTYVKAKMDWLATIRGRLGVANDRALAYVTGGLALAGVEQCGNSDVANPCAVNDAENAAWSGTRPGLVAGAGVEARLSDRWSFKSEYLYLVTADKNVVYDPAEGNDIDFGFDAHLFRVGLNYKLY